jgi:tagatose 6-phosphate kinase
MILCFGATPAAQRTMIFNRLQVDDVNRAISASDHAAGKSINVARVAHTLGGNVLACTVTGGARGQFLRDELHRENIACQSVNVACETRLCVTIVDQSAHTATELVEEAGPLTAAEWLSVEAMLRQELPRASTWVFSGTLPQAAPADFYARFLSLAKQQHSTVIIDARGEPMLKCLEHEGFIAKMNRDELAGMTGTSLATDTELQSAMLRIRPRGGRLIVTLGAAGALVCEENHFLRIHSPAVKPVSAVGSGDAFAAGLAIALDRQSPQPPSDAHFPWRLATACGAANALTNRSGHLDPLQVNRLCAEVKIEVIEQA